ncbi:MAG: polysaccharide biosynthesis C-terminal domain-containing protein [Rikenellaceae bacterium]
MLRKLASQTVIYGLSTILVKFINYMLTPYLTYRLSKEVIGEQGYFYSIIPFGLVLLTMGFETGYFRFCGKAKSDEEKKELFSTILIFISAISILFFAGVWFFTPELYEITLSAGVRNISIIPLVGGIVATDAILAIIYTKIREEGRAKKFLVTRVFNVLVNVGFCLLFYSVLPYAEPDSLLGSWWNEGSASVYVFTANLIASLATLLLLVTEIHFTPRPFNPKIIKPLLIFSLPLMVSSIGGTANEFVDRQLLAFLLPESIKLSSVGIYSSVMKIAALIYLFNQMYRFAAEPLFLSNVSKDNFKEYNAQALKYFTIVSIGIFLFVTAYIDIFKYFIGAEFRVGLGVVPILLLSNILIGIYLNLSFWYKITEKTIFATIITFTGLIITVLLNFLLIPRYGYVGSAWARLSCEAAMVLLSYYLNQKYYPINYDLKSVAKYTLVGAVIFVCCWWSPFEGWLKFLVNSILFITFIVYFVKVEKIDVKGEFMRVIKRK